VDGEGWGKYVAEKLNAIFDTVEAAGLAELFEGYRLGGIDALGLYPLLDTVEIERGHFHREPLHID